MENTEIHLLGEVRSTQGQEKGKVVEGYALKFNTYAKMYNHTDGDYFETILPEALANTDLSDVRCFADHDSGKVLGRNVAGTLITKVDEVGLYIKCFFPDTSYASDLYNSIQRGDINQMSFGFIMSDQDYTDIIEDGRKIRVIHNIELIYEVSIVSVPAYNDTLVAIAQRSAKKAREENEKTQELELLKLKLDLGLF